MLTPNQNSRFPVRADPRDFRDYQYVPTRAPLREIVDLRSLASPVENQGRLGSCVGQAVVGAYELLYKHDAPALFEDLSRLYVYYNARLLEDTIDQDVGAFVRDGIKGVRRYGICAEALWPYNVKNFAITPSIAAYQDAGSRNIKNYYRISTLPDILDALNTNKPVVCGLSIFGGFDGLDAATDYVVPMPGDTEAPLGGHAMAMVGYDLLKSRLLARNSFGDHWGMDGYCWIPFDYATSSFFDMWTFDIDLIPGKGDPDLTGTKVTLLDTRLNIRGYQGSNGTTINLK